MSEQLTYDPRLFFCRDSEAARSIILTPEAGLTTNDRWERETAWLADRLAFSDDARLVIDYGCGIGRIAKVLPMPVLGVDISATMRAQAIAYVQRNDVGIVSPFMMQTLIERGLRASGAIAVWSLQHVAAPEVDIRLLFNALLPSAPLYLINRQSRYVPVSRGEEYGFVNDGKDIGALMEEGGFVLVHDEPMPETLCAPGAYFRRYERAVL
jgi:SAM-dependent methyltransferase